MNYRLLDVETEEEKSEKTLRKPIQQGLMNLLLQRTALLDDRCFSCKYFRLKNKSGNGMCFSEPPINITVVSGFIEKVVWERPPVKESDICRHHIFKKSVA